jgi:hypothetical protein
MALDRDMTEISSLNMSTCTAWMLTFRVPESLPGIRHEFLLLGPFICQHAQTF